MTVDARAMRDAMGCFATGITVVSTLNGDGRAVGMTVNSFNSVSLEPPLILFSLDREASLLPCFTAADNYAVSVLSAAQQSVSADFAKSGQNGFDLVPHSPGRSGMPTIDGCLAVFECEPFAQYDGGDHVIFVGKVIDIAQADDSSAPLLYFRGGYAGIG